MTHVVWLAELGATALIAGLLSLTAACAVDPESITFLTPALPTQCVVDGSTVAISLRFDTVVDHKRSSLALRNRQGVRQLRPRLSSEPKYLFGSAGRLEPGAYELTWRARLSNGKTSSGTVPFMVR